MAQDPSVTATPHHSGVKVYDRPPARPLWAIPVALMLVILLWYIVSRNVSRPVSEVRQPVTTENARPLNAPTPAAINR